MIKAVIFDMDGTMVDSEMLHFRAYQQVLGELGAVFDLQDYIWAWGSDKDMCMRIADNFSLPISKEELLERKNNVFRDVFIHKVTPRPGLVELLELLQKNTLPMAVASSSQIREIKTVLNAIGVTHFFKEILSAESVMASKPAPDIYLLAAKRLGVSPKDCLVLEDAPKGVQSAKAAGMVCYAIPGFGFGKKNFAMADKMFADLSEVAAKFAIQSVNIPKSY